MRIKLDLSDFLEDERKLVVLSVNEEEARTVRDVLAKIIKLFKLSPWHQDDADIVHSKKLNLGLFEEEFFLHPDETSSVLHGIGLLKLKTLPSSQEAEGKKKKKGKKKAKEEDKSVNETAKEKRKRNASPDVLPPQRREERRERRIKVEDVISTSESDSNVREETSRKRKRASTSEEESSIEESRGKRKSKRSKFSKLEANFCDVNESKIHSVSNSDLLTESDSETEHLTNLGRRRNVPYLGGGSCRRKSRNEMSSLQSTGRSNDYEIGTDIKWKKKTKVIEEFEIDGDELQELYCKKGTKGQQIELGFEESRSSKRNRFQNLAVDYELGNLRSKKKSGETDIIEKQKELERRYLEDKKSQVKVVSTSTVINLLSDDSLDDESSDKSEKTVGEKLSNIRSYEQDDGPHAADSVTDPSASFEPCGPLKTGKRKRIRKHKKKKRNEQQSVIENETTYGNIPEKAVFDREVAYNFPFAKPRSTKQGMQPINQGKHVFFESEEEIISNNEKERSSVHDVEVLATASSIFRKDSQLPEQSSRKESFRQTRQRLTEPVVVEIEGEATLPSSSSVFAPSRYQPQRRQIPSFSDRQFKKHKKEDSDVLFPGQDVEEELHLGDKFRYSTPVMKKKPPVQVQDDECIQMLRSEDYPSVENKAISLPSQPSDDTDDLATFKRICENNTLMVVKVDPRRRPQVKPQVRETNKTGNTLNLGPPSHSDHCTVDVSEESRQTFHNLTMIENSDMTLIIPRARRSLRGSEEKSVGERNTNYANSGNNVEQENCSQSGNGTCTEVPQPHDSINSMQDRRNRSKSCEIIENNMERTQLNHPSNSNSSSVDTNSKLSPNKPEFGMHSHYRKKNRPRVFQSVGAVLASLKYSNEEGREPIAEPTSGKEKVHEAALEQKLSQAEVYASKQSSDAHKDFSTESNNVLKENVNQTDGSRAVEDDDIVHLESDEEDHVVQTKNVVPETLDDLDVIEERRERMQGIAERGELSDVQRHQEIMFSEQFKNIPGIMEAVPEGYRGFPEILAKVLGGGVSMKHLLPEQETMSHRENELISKDSVKEKQEVTLDDEKSNQLVSQTRQDISVNKVHSVPEEASDIVPEDRENLILERRKNEDLGEISEVVSGKLKGKEEEVVLDEFPEDKKRSPMRDDLCITKEVQERVLQKVEDEDIRVVVDDDVNVPGDLNNDRAVVNKNDDSRSDVKVVPETEDSSKEMKDDMKKTKMEIIELAKSAEDDDFEKFPLMESAPRVGELIALKVVSLDEGYRPVYSNYVKAQILAVKGWKIKLRYIDDVESMKKGDKEEVADVEEVDLTSDDEEQDDLIEVLDWRDIHAPRLLYP
ncbi:uncharacterized protein LOC125035094 isoform X2 [Penaeus chinensis]|uniref:uncharacterized protein LOC125035094 isoform X2 n=1 Tax=Penaeus chinensis TaxID=139456 RepID=UPI001FB6FDE4|nr:uncharacterized protein LOC125035094 isoform X2 [Penaeus chinensis]